MSRSRVLAAIALALVLAGCNAAARVGIIRKDFLSDAQQVIAAMEIAHGNLSITGSVDRADTTYAPGQSIALSATVSRDAFVAIVRTLPDGTTTILFPNKDRPKSAVSANTPLAVPGPGDAVAITAGKAGVELFEFIASTDENSWLFKRPPAPGEDFAELGVTTRAIAKDIVTSLHVGRGPDTAATYLTIRVR